ncbi:serine/threonine protein kinase [Nonomuraea rubra]|uniref:serine/threonine protein kinase n=1 Tax=Nonomuraea rubra TaxID=46180 RepID=UPI00361EEEC9
MAENDSPKPERIGGHEIVGRLGEGPRGVVHLGRESEESPQVVVKTLHVDPETDPGFAERLRNVTRVSSSYVARTIAAGVEDGRPYVIREHVEGRSLAEAVAADGPLSGDALDRVAVGMLTALTAVHVAGFAHRALTPSNVILTADGPRVTDVELGEPAGELGFRAPEQIAGLQYGPYADVFSWAATVVFAATGAAPFEHDKESVLNGEPEVGELPEPLRQVVVAALAKEVTGRPTAYVALLRLLGDANAPMPAPAIQGVPVPPPGTGDLAPTLLDGVPVPPRGGQPDSGPVPPPGGQAPLILPIQLSIEGAQVPQLPDGPMHPQGSAHPSGPMHPQGPMMQGPMMPGPMVPGPVAGPGPMGEGPMPPGRCLPGRWVKGRCLPPPCGGRRRWARARLRTACRRCPWVQARRCPARWARTAWDRTAWDRTAWDRARTACRPSTAPSCRPRWPPVRWHPVIRKPRCGARRPWRTSSTRPSTRRTSSTGRPTASRASRSPSAWWPG